MNKATYIIIIVVILVLILGVIIYIFTRKETEEKSEVTDCGITNTLMSTNALKEAENDPVLSCLGKGFNECKKVKAVINDSYRGAVLIEINNTEICNIRMSLGDESQFTREDYKQYANKYIECPVESLKELVTQAGKDSSEITNSGWGFNAYFFLGGLASFSEQAEKAAKSIGCTGSLLE